MNIKQVFNSKPLKIGLFLLTLCYTLWRLFRGLDFTDTFFWLNTESADFTMTEGFSVVVRLISNVFGKELYVYRLIFWFLMVLSLLFPYLLLQKKDKWIYNLHYLFLGLICITTSFLVFNPDSFTIFLFSLGVTFFIKFIQATDKYVYLIVLAVFTAVSVFFRFPNILLFPAIILLLSLIPFFTKEKKWKIKDVLKIEFLFVITYLLVFVFVALLLHGTKYVEEIRLSFSGAQGAHSIDSMLSFIQRDFSKIVFYVAFCFLMREFCRYYDTIKIVKWKVLMGGAIVLFFVFIIRYNIIVSAYQWQLRLFLCSILLYFMILDVFKTNKNLIFYLSIIAFAAVSAAGSDTGLAKMLPIFLCFLPFIVFKTQFNISKNIITLLLVIMLHLIVLFEFHETFEDIRRPHKATQTIQVDNLKYIKTTQERAALIESVLAEYYTLKDDSTKIIFYGQNAHIFRYLTNEETIYKSSFRMKFSADFLKLENAILKYNPIVFHTPTYPNEYYDSDTVLDSMLLKENYSEIIKENYRIFLPAVR